MDLILSVSLRRLYPLSAFRSRLRRSSATPKLFFPSRARGRAQGSKAARQQDSKTARGPTRNTLSNLDTIDLCSVFEYRVVEEPLQENIELGASQLPHCNHCILPGVDTNTALPFLVPAINSRLFLLVPFNFSLPQCSSSPPLSPHTTT